MFILDPKPKSCVRLFVRNPKRSNIESYATIVPVAWDDALCYVRCMSRWWNFFWLLFAVQVSYASESFSRRIDDGCADETVAGRIVPFEMVGKSEAMDKVREWIARVAPHNTPALILGESGTGKELVAEAIHASSNRRGKAFEALNVTAINESLLESELFGHERGAFTGADRLRKGLFERAAGGTLFLDELGEMSLEMQAKLLRVLEGHPFLESGDLRKSDPMCDLFSRQIATWRSGYAKVCFARIFFLECLLFL